MKKRYLKIFAIVAGIFFLFLLLANLGLNFWLKNKLPDYVKTNSDYIISYKSLNVDLITGNILAKEITVNNKNPQNQEVIGIQGTVDEASVSRLGIYNAVFKKRISSTDLSLKKPNLNITLAKPVDNKTGKKKNPPVFENIRISDGNLQIFRHTKQKFLAVNDLNLYVENLQMTEESVERKLPVVFDKYDINGKNFFFRPDNVYAFTATYITTKEGQMTIKNFALTPLLSYQNFRRYFPKKRNLYDFKSSEMQFTDIVLTDNKIALKNVDFKDPDLKMYTTNVKPQEKKKSFTYDVNLEDVLMRNAKVNILKPDGTPLFSAGNLTLNINKFLMNDETAKGNVPFNYENFKINGQNVNYNSDRENVRISALAINPKSVDLRNISVNPTVSVSDKTLLDFDANNVNVKINDWQFRNNKLKLDVQNVLVNGLNGTIAAAKNPAQKKPNYSGIEFPLTVKNVQLKNSNLVYDKGNNPLTLSGANANIQNIEMNAETVKSGIPFKTGNYSLTTRNFSYKTQFYNLTAASVNFNKNKVEAANFACKPTVSRAQYIRMIPTEKDLYDITVNDISAIGNWDFVSANKFIDASQVTLNGTNANIFRSKVPKDDTSEKLLYSRLLRNIKFPMFIQNLDIKNSIVEYEEDTKKSDGPGKLTFANFNMNVKNLNSAKMKGKPTLVPIAISCRFMNASPMNVKWSFDTANMSDAFSISGNIADLPAARINPFIEPYLKVRATGLISDLIFYFKGNYNGLNGTLKMVHQDLKVSILDKNGDKKKLLSAVANIFVRTDSGKYPESVVVDNVKRDKTKSFFNLFWKGIEEGLKKTLIGSNVEKTEKTVKNVVKDVKDIKGNNLTQPKAEETPKKKGGLRNLFKKKSGN